MGVPSCSVLLIVKDPSPRLPATLVGRTVTHGAMFVERKQCWVSPSFQPSPGKVRREGPSSLTPRGSIVATLLSEPEPVARARSRMTE